MSGTSMDGIDVAALETDGESHLRFGPSALHLYRHEDEVLLRRAVEAARSLSDRTARPGILAEAERMLTMLHAGAVQTFLDANGIDPDSVGVVGFHGQTVLHSPERRLTVQLGDGPALARELGLPVVYDFRAADVAAGGQGAPLVPVYHRALAQTLERPHPIAVLNVGGVANITYIDSTPDPFACDTGPGNALVDDFMRARAGHSYDAAGVNAAQGLVDAEAVARVLAHPFFSQPLPKSLDRNAFREFAAKEARLADKSIEDGAATLTAITAASVAAIVKLLPVPPRSWIVCGGGVHNVTLIRMLTERLAPATVETADDVKWSADAIEAQAFAYMAVRRLRDLPITFPTTTGVPKPTCGGVLVRP
jgi:anhydro-N-acetylmuramic acid kinase